MNRTSEIKKIFEETGAIITGTHVIYTSGKHGSTYINKNAIYPYTEKISTLCKFIADDFKEESIDAVMGPVVGGIALAQWTAHHLSQMQNKEIVALCADKIQEGNETRFVIKRGQEKFVQGKRILVVEDNLTTGSSVQKVVQAIRDLQGEVIGVGALCNRGKVTVQQLGNVPQLKTLLEVDFESFSADQCPLCKNNIPINESLGKGK